MEEVNCGKQEMRKSYSVQQRCSKGGPRWVRVRNADSWSLTHTYRIRYCGGVAQSSVFRPPCHADADQSLNRTPNPAIGKKFQKCSYKLFSAVDES